MSGTLCVVVLSGCGTGRPADVSSWQGSSDRTLGQAISGLGTARVAVEQGTHRHLPHTYAVVAVTDMIDTTATEISSYLVEQPPDRLQGANRAVVSALQEAEALLVDVRVALASPGLSAAQSRVLVTRIDDLRDRLDKLDSGVTASPPTVSPR